MTRIRKLLALSALAATTPICLAQSAPPTTPPSHHRTHHQTAAADEALQQEINELRQQMQAQIDALQQQLTARDEQLQQAHQSAQQAQAAAQTARRAADNEQQTISANNQAVSSLQSSVSDLKASTDAMTTTVQQQQARIRKEVEDPDAVHFKGITLSPTGSFVEFATVDRNHATASGIASPLSSIPFPGADAYNLSEFEMSGRQSRIALLAQGKVANATIRGYYEADWLGSGTTSNNNQSNSYVLRQRVLFAQAQMNDGWIITGGQQWSLATEYTKGLFSRSEAVPYTIDPNYQAGFVWTRQPGLHIVKDFGGKAAFGISVENDQTLSPSCQASGAGATACPTNYVVGAPGAGSGDYNGGGSPTGDALASYSYNLAPMLVAKVAFDPSWAHIEAYGVSRFFRDRIYPNATATTPSAAGAYDNDIVAGGGGGSVRFHVGGMGLGVEGLYGDGTGRLGDSGLPDVTVRPDGALSPLHSFSGLAFLEGHATTRLDLYGYYGGDYVGRDFVTDATGGETGYGTWGEADTGCDTEVLPGTSTGSGYSPGSPAACGSSNKDVQEATGGYWYNFYSGRHGKLRQGLQYSYVERNLWGDSAGISPKTSDNVIETSFRYYLP